MHTKHTSRSCRVSTTAHKELPQPWRDHVVFEIGFVEKHMWVSEGLEGDETRVVETEFPREEMEFHCLLYNFLCPWLARSSIVKILSATCIDLDSQECFVEEFAGVLHEMVKEAISVGIRTMVVSAEIEVLTTWQTDEKGSDLESRTERKEQMQKINREANPDSCHEEISSKL